MIVKAWDLFIYYYEFLTIELESNVPSDARPEDETESRKITEFLDTGCQCDLECYELFPRAHYELIRNQCSELSHEALNMVIMGQLMALTHGGSAQTLFMHQGRQVLKHEQIHKH